MINTIRISISLHDKNAVYLLADRIGFDTDELKKLDIIATKNINGKIQQLNVSQSAIMNMAERYTGIEFISLQQYFEPQYHRLTIDINPQQLLSQKCDEALFDGSSKNIIALNEKFSIAMSSILGSCIPKLLDLHSWLIEYVEYAIDINMLNSRNVSTYTRIIKYRIDSAYQHDEPASFHVYKPTPEEVANKLGAYLSVSDLGVGLARLKTLCRGNAIHPAKTEKDEDTSAWSCLAHNTAISNIWYYYQRIIGFGDFYTKVIAQNLVEKSSYRHKKRELLLFITAADLAGNIASLKANFEKGICVEFFKRMRKYVHNGRDDLIIKGTSYKFKQHRHDLLALNINVIPITRRLYSSTCCSHFINPLRRINFHAGYSVNIATPDEYADIKYCTESGIAPEIYNVMAKWAKR